MNPAFSSSRSRAPALLAVLLLHLAAGLLLLRTHGPDAKQKLASRTELRLLVPKPPRLPNKPVAPEAPRERPRAPPLLSTPELPPLQQAGPTAITLPATPVETAPVPLAPHSPPAAASAPLDLRMPGRGPSTAPPSGIAELMRNDPRANSPRESADERMARAFGGGETTVIEGVQGGRMIRGPNGECTLLRPSMMQEIDPTNDRHRMLPGKASDCSQLQNGARRHKRPGSR